MSVTFSCQRQIALDSVVRSNAAPNGATAYQNGRYGAEACTCGHRWALKANWLGAQGRAMTVRTLFWEFAWVGLIVTLVTTLAGIALLALEHRLFPGY
jgi:hypothetical protein